ncbi:MAG: tRNA (adenosine(37)-N6)-dimethylallyltransferase MiaA [Actinomycetaceae bacterium]|nr:tRNA (adenosine(37)-N6)-dimethylallyltransferase MiaA [Actinomycetaceae bacterium]
MTLTQPILAIVGPTASGKTALSLEVAELLGGSSAVEIISADAMQLYRGMDIGTAKLPAAERRGIVHHQFDVLDVTDTASVAAYQAAARAAIEDIANRGKIPMLVGGSGLYVSAALDELNFPGTDPQIRAELEQIWQTQGLEPLIAELREKDPVSADTINLANPRRVIRALEVVRLTGESYTPKFPRHTAHYTPIIHIGVRRDRELLDQAIRDRAVQMFEEGLLAETRALLENGLREGPTAAKATGYAQAIAVIDGEISVAEAIDQVAFATRRLAKKQRTWFGADKRIEWVDLSAPPEEQQSVLRQAAEAIVARFGQLD